MTDIVSTNSEIQNLDIKNISQLRQILSKTFLVTVQSTIISVENSDKILSIGLLASDKTLSIGFNIFTNSDHSLSILRDAVFFFHKKTYKLGSGWLAYITNSFTKISELDNHELQLNEEIIESLVKICIPPDRYIPRNNQ